MVPVRCLLAVLLVGVLFTSAPSAQDQRNKTDRGLLAEPETAQLVGAWEVFQTKEPGQPYKPGYKDQPFVGKGANAFTLIMEYRKDGTFRRITRIGNTETVQDGTWKLSGHELRHERPGALEEEVMYIRFDGPDEYTSVDVYEGSPDPGLFGRFRRIK